MVVDDASIARWESARWARLVGKPSWRDDARQEALLGLWAHPENPARRLVARSAIADAWRRENGRGRDDLIFEEVDEPREDPSFDEVLERMTLNRAVLSGRERAVVDCLVHQWRQTEIADALGLHYSSVSLIVGRVRERIRASQI